MRPVSRSRSGGEARGRAVLVALLAACAPLEGPLEAEVGTGETAFVAVEDGEALSLASGGQGGLHVWTSVRVRGVGADRPAIRVTLSDAAGAVVCGDEFAQVRTEPRNGWWELAGLTCGIFDSAAIRGRPLVLRADVTAAGQTVSSVRHVTVT